MYDVPIGSEVNGDVPAIHTAAVHTAADADSASSYPVGLSSEYAGQVPVLRHHLSSPATDSSRPASAARHLPEPSGNSDHGACSLPAPEWPMRPRHTAACNRPLSESPRSPDDGADRLHAPEWAIRANHCSASDHPASTDTAAANHQHMRRLQL